MFPIYRTYIHAYTLQLLFHHHCLNLTPRCSVLSKYRVSSVLASQLDALNPIESNPALTCLAFGWSFPILSSSFRLFLPVFKVLIANFFFLPPPSRPFLPFSPIEHFINRKNVRRFSHPAPCFLRHRPGRKLIPLLHCAMLCAA